MKDKKKTNVDLALIICDHFEKRFAGKKPKRSLFEIWALAATIKEENAVK